MRNVTHRPRRDVRQCPYFILLVEEGATLPSNSQGLYEARYKGDVLDSAATMKLLRTLREFKT